LVEAADSPEVQTFMATFHRLRDRICDDPGVLEREEQVDHSLAKLCRELSRAASFLTIAQRRRRQLYSAPTNPNFVAAWRDYEANYARPVARVFLFGLGLSKKTPPGEFEEKTADGNDDFKLFWESEQDEAESNAEGFKAVIELVEDEIEVQATPSRSRSIAESRNSPNKRGWAESMKEPRRPRSPAPHRETAIGIKTFRDKSARK
jgi:hypothetical protein